MRDKYRSPDVWFTRSVVGGYAIVTLPDGRHAMFAVPPDGEPTGRLWAALEEGLVRPRSRANTGF